PPGRSHRGGPASPWRRRSTAGVVLHETRRDLLPSLPSSPLPSSCSPPPRPNPEAIRYALGMKVRRVTQGDADRVTEIFVLAFNQDPTWSWAFPDDATRMDHHRRLWGLYLHSAVPYGWVWMTDDGGAASLWIPPGESELTEEDEEKLVPLARELIGSHADDVLGLMGRFNDNHPRDRGEHFYLSLLGTHPDHRGQGKGMGLLAANLDQIDELGMPAYLESSNRGNDHRYERLGFELIGEFTGPSGEPTVGCMWREPR